MTSLSAARAAIFTATLWLTACQPPPPVMTPDQTTRMHKLTAHLVPRCVGRYLIDLPSDFVINPVSRAVIEGVTMEIKPMTETDFRQQFHWRKTYLEQALLPGDEKLPHLKKTIELPGGQGLGGIFDRSTSTASGGRLGRTLDLMAWKDGYLITSQIEATDTTFPEYAMDSIARQLKTNTPEKLAHLLHVYSRTRGRADNEIPTEPGTCFRYGFVQGKATDQEWIDVNYHLSIAEDVYFTFHYMSHIGPMEKSLLQRGAAIEEELQQVNGRTLRKGSRLTNGLKFDEWLAERESDPGVKDYDLTLELNSKAGTASEPLFMVELASGVRHPHAARSLEESAVLQPIKMASFDAAESIALWDTVSVTLRPRPNGF